MLADRANRIVRIEPSVPALAPARRPALHETLFCSYRLRTGSPSFNSE